MQEGQALDAWRERTLSWLGRRETASTMAQGSGSDDRLRKLMEQRKMLKYRRAGSRGVAAESAEIAREMIRGKIGPGSRLTGIERWRRRTQNAGVVPVSGGSKGSDEWTLEDLSEMVRYFLSSYYDAGLTQSFV